MPMNDLEILAEYYGYSSHAAMKKHVLQIVDRMVYNYNHGLNPQNILGDLNEDFHGLAMDMFNDEIADYRGRGASTGAKVLAGAAGVAAGIFGSRRFLR